MEARAALPTHVYILSYARPMPNGVWTGMYIGVYTSAEKMEAAKARLRQRSGFRDYPDGFYVNCYRTDEDYDEPTFFVPWNLPES
jgi:hypothetical protein